MIAYVSGPAASLTDAVRAIDEVAAIDPVSCTDDELAEAVGQWCHALSRLQAVGAPLLAAWDARRLWALDGSVNGPHWLRTHGEVDDATGRVRVARRLRDWCPRTAAALASGRLSATKAAIIARAPTALTAADFAGCEDILVETAIQLSVRQTVTLMREWKAVADSPLGGGEVDLAEVQRTAPHLRIWETFAGMIAVEGVLVPETGAA